MTYQAPYNDIDFCLNTIHNFPAHYESLGISLDSDLLQAVLSEAGKFAESVLHPLNAVGDKEGVSFSDGEVIAPPGFKQAYRDFVNGGWPSLAHPANYGGQALPGSLSLVAQEMWQAANQSWCMYAMTNEGACMMLNACGTDDLKDRFLAKLISGEWIATMDITESQAGSDVGLIKTRSEPAEDGTYRITGNKIFISSGDHDLAENIVHFVLARLPDAPKGSRGLSLFVVPKINVNDDGSLGPANSLGCSSIEHKMGLKGSATCAMYYDAANGYLLGEPNQGLAVMFRLINKSRLGVAIQGLAQMEGSLQMAKAYAQERRQGRSPTGLGDPKGDSLVDHPDIRRMLTTQQAFSEGCRSLIYGALKNMDIAQLGEQDQASHANDRLALLIPILKGCISEWGFEATDLGIQVFGGHGYTTDWGIEQRSRDVRVTRIYEGTTGIQAQDFLLRKVLRDEGESLGKLFRDEQEKSLSAGVSCLNPGELQRTIEETLYTTKEIAVNRNKLTPGTLEFIAFDYLMLNGYLLLGLQWARIAGLTETPAAVDELSNEVRQEKRKVARFYFDYLLPRARLHLAIVKGKIDGDASAEAPSGTDCS